jgi:hypothetical protein
MNDSKNPIQSQPARFVVGGASRGQGIVLLYPDKLAAVITRAQAWGYIVGPIALVAIAYPFIHVIGALGAAIGVLAGGWAGEAIDKRSAARKVAAGRDGVTLIPLDLITSLQTRKSAGIGGWLSGRTLLVTTADGTEYGFRGKTDRLQADLASALTARGGEVRVTPQGITVTPELTRE